MTGTSATELKVAVLIGDEYIPQWERSALASLVAEPDIEITHVVINDRKNAPDHRWKWMTFARNAFEQIRKYPLWSLVGVARLLTPAPEYERPVHIDSIEGLSNAERLFCTPELVEEFWNTLPDETVDHIENVDIVVRFGFGMIKGRILRAPKYGVLSYHPGDIRQYRGQPGGFWEFLNGEDEMGVTVQRLNETLDGGEIAALEIIDISGMNTWQEIKKQVYYTAENMLIPAVRTLTESDTTVEPPDQIGDLYSIPEGWAVLRYVVKNTRGRIQHYITGKTPTPIRILGRAGAIDNVDEPTGDSGAPGMSAETRANVETFSSSEANNLYIDRATDGLFPQEQKAIERYFGKPDARVLDLGCGTGRVTHHLSGMGFDVIGVDPSDSMIDVATSVHPQIDFVVGDGTDLHFQDDAFDYVLFSYYGLDYIYPEEQRIRALREIYRVLKPGGIFVFSSHNWWNSLPSTVYEGTSALQPLLNRENVLDPRDRYAPVEVKVGETLVYLSSPAKQRQQLQRCGFEVLDIVGKRDTVLRYVEAAPHYVAQKPIKNL